jgi:uncharacterized membrane protein YgcG
MLKNSCLYTAIALCSIALTAHAQSSKADEHLFKPAGAVTIDGNLKDWGDSLRYYNQEKKLYYTVANDGQYLYLAMRFNDHSEQERILWAGLTWGINPHGKKKETYSLTFPATDPASAPAIGARPPESDEQGGQKPNEVDREVIRKAHLTKLRNMKVTGFKDIDYDMITTTNSYGFKAALDYDAEGNMVYEAAIPLKFFDVADIAKGEWAFNFKVNGITRSLGATGSANRPEGGMGGGRRGMGGGSGRGGMGGGGMAGGGRGGRGGSNMGGGQTIDRSSLSKSEDFWEKFYLSTVK